jgi:release factor glutamine methyltransferase
VPETATVATLLRAAATRLEAAGITDPRREARRIWQDLMEGRSAPLLEGEAQVSREDVDRMDLAVARRAAGEPLAHVTGLIGFRRLTLRSDRRALIPRPETEGLVELLLSRQPDGRVVDVGTGSGCIALSLADEGQYRDVVAIDQSAEALALAGENVALTGQRISLVRGDLLAAVAPASMDAVVSNPPYLTDREYATLDGSVRDWEPSPAFASGADGLEATRRLITMALMVVRPAGWLALEVDVLRAGDVAAMAQAAGWSDAMVHMDLFGRARFVTARRNEAA